MNKLEQTLISMAQQQLSAVLRFHKKREAGTATDDDVEDYQRDCGSLFTLLELGHLSDSGLGDDAVSALLKVEDQHSAAVRAANPPTKAVDSVSQKTPRRLPPVTQNIQAIPAIDR